MVSRNGGDRWARPGHSPEVVDRVLIGLCALIWLVLLGMSVAAIVALVDLGRGFHQPKNPHTGLLYIVIGVSVLVILAAIPVLLRARQAAPPGIGFGDRPPTRVPLQQPVPTRADVHAPGRREQTVRRVRPNQAAVDRVLLRGITELTGAIGAGLTAVAVATYLMAVGKDTGSWVCYGVAGAITLAMPVIPWLHLRQLREVLTSPVRFG
ncbi:DUF2561 family protein [Mycobacterium sp. M1]|uniref:DUF2561 family protein n=1 Tax=Mycolicibacter acidiphilus TaxID=2835306 RepID=A0ABS5RFB0_9MYCO|nr:DUF2561 family protein [Mycolicibacter acidiphilus]MBS9532953.1 DUF2561 family protein [Mycolicibacter acidiphilus]